mmetsp:Transcript_10487/g.16403  ORF Transcript_10487/g.16403 Transcript_10487/m.16403 type:complete len:283 (+) Transcript_10487:286-1134(+)
MNLAKKHGVNLDKASIVNPATANDFHYMVDKLVELRKHKGVTKEYATNIMEQDPTWYGTMMMLEGKADGMVSGAIHTTADTMRPALQLIKTEPGINLVSSVFFMLLPDHVYVFGDCAINVDPNSEELAQIAISSAKTAQAFGINPRVAMLSYATGQSNQGPMIDKVRQATQKVKDEMSEIHIEGPMQFDAAVDAEVAKVKVKDGTSEVAGKATVCIFPDLNTGNNTYKAVQQAARCVAIGPIMQGLRKPVNDLSRGCTVQDIVSTVVITCVQAIAVKGKNAK